MQIVSPRVCRGCGARGQRWPFRCRKCGRRYRLREQLQDRPPFGVSS